VNREARTLGGTGNFLPNAAPDFGAGLFANVKTHLLVLL